MNSRDTVIAPPYVRRGARREPAIARRTRAAAENTETARILKLPDVSQKLLEQSAEPVGNTPQQFDAFIKSEIVKWAKVIKDAKVELQ